MTKAEEIEFSNMMDGIRKLEAAACADKNKAEIEKIRQYCIDAVTDYHSVVDSICKLINDNKDLWANPYIKGSYHGYIGNEPHYLSAYDYTTEQNPFHFTKGYFNISVAGLPHTLTVNVKDIYGIKKRTGYAGGWEDHDKKTDGWVADSVSVEVEHTSWEKNLITSTFDVATNGGETLHYTIENLKKYNWSIEGWTTIKHYADNTKKMLETIVHLFKTHLRLKMNEKMKLMNEFTNASETSNYVKVDFQVA